MGRRTTGRKPVRIPYVAWRDGRPRFSPSATLRRLGHVGCDLRHEGPGGPGAWFSEGEARDWSNAFATRLDLQAGDPSPPAGKGTRRHTARRGGRPRHRISLRQLVERFVVDRQREIAAGAIRLKARTLADYDYQARYAERAWPSLWTMAADDIERHHIKKLHKTLALAHGLPTAAHTVRALSLMFTWGMAEEGMLQRAYNPCFQLRLTQPRPRLRTGTLKEIDALLAAADAMGLPFIGDAIMLGLCTGQRQGDRLAMLHEGLDENGRYVFRQSKRGAIVAIKPLPQLTARIEASQARRRARGALFPHVLMNERTWQPMDGDSYRKLFALVRSSAMQGIRHEDGTLNSWLVEPCPSLATLTDQDLRDTAVTWMARGGATIPEICAVTGHSLQSATTILRHYLETNADMADRAIDAMVGYWESQIDKPDRNSR